MKCGLWCLFGMLVFIIVEKLFATSEEEEDGEKEPKPNGSIRQIEIEEIDKLLDVERRNRYMNCYISCCAFVLEIFIYGNTYIRMEV